MYQEKEGGKEGGKKRESESERKRERENFTSFKLLFLTTVSSRWEIVSAQMHLTCSDIMSNAL